jgi:hypothetical protein
MTEASSVIKLAQVVTVAGSNLGRDNSYTDSLPRLSSVSGKNKATAVCFQIILNLLFTDRPAIERFIQDFRFSQRWL